MLDGTGSTDGVLVEPHNACKQAALEDFLKVNMIRRSLCAQPLIECYIRFEDPFFLNKFSFSVSAQERPVVDWT